MIKVYWLDLNVSVQFSSRWYLCNQESPIFTPIGVIILTCTLSFFFMQGCVRLKFRQLPSKHLCHQARKEKGRGHDTSIHHWPDSVNPDLWGTDPRSHTCLPLLVTQSAHLKKKKKTCVRMSCPGKTSPIRTLTGVKHTKQDTVHLWGTDPRSHTCLPLLVTQSAHLKKKKKTCMRISCPGKSSTIRTLTGVKHTKQDTVSEHPRQSRNHAIKVYKPSSILFPSLISLMVSVDVKHHVSSVQFYSPCCIKVGVCRAEVKHTTQDTVSEHQRQSRNHTIQ